MEKWRVCREKKKYPVEWTCWESFLKLSEFWNCSTKSNWWLYSWAGERGSNSTSPFSTTKKRKYKYEFFFLFWKISTNKIKNTYVWQLSSTLFHLICIIIFWFLCCNINYRRRREKKGINKLFQEKKKKLVFTEIVCRIIGWRTSTSYRSKIRQAIFQISRIKLFILFYFYFILSFFKKNYHLSFC